MLKKYLHPFRFSLELVRKLFQWPSPPDDPEDLAEFDDFINADMTLGLAAQDICRTRDELVNYAWNAQLVPYLRPFLDRRGWLDDDWNSRLDALADEFRRQLN